MVRLGLYEKQLHASCCWFSACYNVTCNHGLPCGCAWTHLNLTFTKIQPFNSHIFASKAMMIYKQSVHINYQCVDRANFLKLQFFLMKCKSLQNSASQQNTLGCQRGMIFPDRKIKTLAEIYIQKHPICRQKFYLKRFQILLLFKLVQASKVDKMNDGVVQRMPLHRVERSAHEE